MTSPTPDHWQIQDAKHLPAVDVVSILLGGPKLDNGAVDVFVEIEAERKADFGRAVDLEAGT
jgi:hypothetical protein